MKKASKILLTISGIVGLVVVPILCILYTILALIPLGPTFIILLIYIPYALFAIVSSIIFLIAKDQSRRGKLITAIVFAVLNLRWLALIGAVLGTIGFKKGDDYELVQVEMNPRDVKKNENVVAYVSKEGKTVKVKHKKQKLTVAGKVLKILGKVCLGLASLESVGVVLLCAAIGLLALIAFGGALVGIVLALIQGVRVLIDMAPQYIDAITALIESLTNIINDMIGGAQGFGDLMNYLLDFFNASLMPIFRETIDLAVESQVIPLIMAHIAGNVLGFVIIILALIVPFPEVFKFIFSLIGAVSPKNKRGIYIANIVVSILCTCGWEFLGGVLGTVGVSLKKKDKVKQLPKPKTK